MAKGISLLIIATLLFLASWFCLMWVFSSSSLAFIPCNGQYSLFHESYQCRQPGIALILWLFTGTTSLLTAYFGIKIFNKNKSAKDT